MPYNKEYHKKYYLQHKERIGIAVKKYRLHHKDEIKKYHSEHKDEKKEYKRKWYLLHKEEQKECSKKYYSEHKDQIKKYNLEHKEEIKKLAKKYRSKYKEEIKKKQKKYIIEHKDEGKRYRLQHKDRIMARFKKYLNNRYANDPIYKRVSSTKTKCSKIIVKIILNGDITAENDAECLKLFGITIDGFKKHIESQFTGTMSWYNRGRMDNPNKWQIDHIIPTSSFDFTIEENFTKAFHYTNTQPLMSSDHVEKSNKEKYEK